MYSIFSFIIYNKDKINSKKKYNDLILPHIKVDTLTKKLALLLDFQILLSLSNFKCYCFTVKENLQKLLVKFALLV